MNIYWKTLKTVSLALTVLASSLFLMSCEKDEPTSNTITDVVLQNNDFTILRAAVSRAGLADALRAGTLTVFAPNDAAFTASGLDLATVNGLDVNTLKAVLQYHVLATKNLSTDLPTASNTEVTTLSGGKAYITKGTDSIWYGKSRADVGTDAARN